jgi:hypothetical protein
MALLANIPGGSVITTVLKSREFCWKQVCIEIRLEGRGVFRRRKDLSERERYDVRRKILLELPDYRKFVVIYHQEK